MRSPALSATYLLHRKKGAHVLAEAYLNAIGTAVPGQDIHHPFLDWALARHLKKELTPEEGAGAKLWHTELQWEVMDKCLQLHGGAGYMNEYPIARAWRAARVTRIFGGTNEIMKELIGRKL